MTSRSVATGSHTRRRRRAAAGPSARVADGPPRVAAPDRRSFRRVHRGGMGRPGSRTVVRPTVVVPPVRLGGLSGRLHRGARARAMPRGRAFVGRGPRPRALPSASAGCPDTDTRVRVRGLGRLAPHGGRRTTAPTDASQLDAAARSLGAGARENLLLERAASGDRSKGFVDRVRPPSWSHKDGDEDVRRSRPPRCAAAYRCSNPAPVWRGRRTSSTAGMEGVAFGDPRFEARAHPGCGPRDRHRGSGAFQRRGQGVLASAEPRGPRIVAGRMWSFSGSTIPPHCLHAEAKGTLQEPERREPGDPGRRSRLGSRRTQVAAGRLGVLRAQQGGGGPERGEQLIGHPLGRELGVARERGNRILVAIFPSFRSTRARALLSEPG